MLKSILILDLGSTFGAELSASLQARGLKIMRCDSIVNLDAALKGSWDLILTEWDFYHLRGAGLIELLNPSRQPILVCSRHDTAIIAAEALEAGASGVFSLFNRTDLIDEIQLQLNEDPEISEDKQNIFV
jgi:DNA-binding response OmpR family regulator